MAELSDNSELHRYELALSGAESAIAVYRDAPGVRIVTHTEVPRHLRGRGVGARLVKAVLDDIRARGLKVVPRCPFVRDYIARFPGYADMVAAAPRAADG
jgi:uncharacterized protein